MLDKKMILIFGIPGLIVGTAALMAVRMLKEGATPLNSDELKRGGSEFMFSSSNNIIPATELPTAPPAATGLFVKRKDNTMIIKALSFDPDIGGILGDLVDVNSAPKVEILITVKTTIYRDTTPASATSTIQQRWRSLLLMI